MIIRLAEACRDSGEAEQPAGSLRLHGNRSSALRGLMEFYEAGQSQDEDETEVDLMVQLSGLVHRDWRMEDPESSGQAPQGGDAQPKGISRPPG